MEPALGAAAAPGAPPTRYRPARRLPGRAGADTRCSSREGRGSSGSSGSSGRRPSARGPSLRAVRAGGQQRAGRRTAPRLAAREPRDHPSPPVPTREGSKLEQNSGAHCPAASRLRAAESPRDPEVPTPAPTFRTGAVLRVRGLPLLIAAPSPGSAPPRPLCRGPPRTRGWCRAPRGKPEPASHSSLARLWATPSRL